MRPNSNQIELSRVRKDRGIKARICSKSSVLLKLTTPPLVPTPSDKRGVLSARTVILTRGCVSARVQFCLPSSFAPPTTEETDCAIRIAGCCRCRPPERFARKINLHACIVPFIPPCLSHCFPVGCGQKETFGLRNKTSLFMRPKRH